MTKLTKTLKSYIDTLPIIGTIILAGGLLASGLLVASKHPEDWSSSYLYSNILGAVIGYLFMSRLNQGGRVTLNFDRSKYSEDENALYNLVVKYRSNILMVMLPTLYLATYFVASRRYSATPVGSLEGFLGSFLLSMGINFMLTMGIKYLSAWWNIKKNWKKEFGE